MARFVVALHKKIFNDVSYDEFTPAVFAYAPRTVHILIHFNYIYGTTVKKRCSPLRQSNILGRVSAYDGKSFPTDNNGTRFLSLSGITMSWFVYMLKCSDGTLYTGVTTDIARRVKEHNGEGGKGKGAKYTKARRPVSLVYQEAVADRSHAQIREHALRHTARTEKMKLTTDLMV